MERFKKIIKYVLNGLAIANALLMGLSPIWGWPTERVAESIMIVIGVMSVYLLGDKGYATYKKGIKNG
ncbi:MAG: hypothetical protein FWE25_03225 [Lachnospiraceae bacterium]|nr:hypothetical protein [Lachnospiraceae bacterium]